MYYYFFINILFTLLVLVSLLFLKSSPFRVRFRITLAALCSWLVPYDFIHDIVSQYQVLSFPISLGKYSDNLKQVIVPQLTTVNNIVSLNLIITILSLAGILLFINNLISLRVKLKRQHQVSSFYKNINGINCYSVIHINAAFSSGIIKPVIWFDKKYINHPNLDSLLQHELQHIKEPLIY